MGTLLFWILFNVVVLGLLALDLGVFHRKSHAVSIREAAIWSAVWIGLSLLFNLGILVFGEQKQAVEFFLGYVIEKSLSVDNIFVFVVLFQFFKVEPKYQHRVLFWGIIGALLMRGSLIAVGAVLIKQFHWVIYLFGAFLIYTGYKLLRHADEAPVDPEHNRLLQFVRRHIPITEYYRESHFFVRENGKLLATPLFVVLFTIETTDLVFALDSIPAIFGITEDPFIVYTSNVCAILGLRALYFLLAGIIDRFQYLKYGIALVLIFVGIKMLVEEFLTHRLHVPEWVILTASLAIVVLLIGGSVVLSLKWVPAHTADISTIPLHQLPGGSHTSAAPPTGSGAGPAADEASAAGSGRDHG